ncbi:hypothetical protein cyc_05760 [Cyclospora cayetanensis]|uniref:Tetratricopeptide repeat-containing protein n=1 Tax=Cyclospora cayetanensis TaxID=88456 RepID=A0A1D3D113_9EIME|nr:hypothetical protein cyc_05760 [Cyclospora cayetanensis]
MEVDGAEASNREGPSPGAFSSHSLSVGKPASFFLSSADDCLNAFPPNFKLAVKFLEKGLSIHPSNVDLLQRLAGEYAETGQTQEAKQLLNKAIELEPSSGPLKFLQLAQLEDGVSCLSLYRKAIEMLEAVLSQLLAAPPPNKRKMCKSSKATVASKRGDPTGSLKHREAQETKTRLVGAYCAVAELYFTDLCDEEEAEREAEKAIQRALELDPKNPEALLCDAQYKKVIDDAEGAVAAAQRVFSSLKATHERLNAASLLVPASGNEEEALEAGDEVSVETRINASRLFVDVGMHQEAIEKLRDLVQQGIAKQQQQHEQDGQQQASSSEVSSSDDDEGMDMA